MNTTSFLLFSFCVVLVALAWLVDPSDSGTFWLDETEYWAFWSADDAENGAFWLDGDEEGAFWLVLSPSIETSSTASFRVLAPKVWITLVTLF